MCEVLKLAKGVGGRKQLLALVLHFVLMSVFPIKIYAWGVSGAPDKDLFSLGCDLESINELIEFQVDYEKNLLTMLKDRNEIRFKKTKQGALRFNLAASDNRILLCDLELPAGALLCSETPYSVNLMVGFCLLIQ